MKVKDIQKIVDNQVKSLIDNGSIQKMVEDGVTSAISSALTKQFESYGNITKQLEKAFDENLKVNTSTLEIPTYNHVMQTVINCKVNEFFKGEAAIRFEKLVDKALAPLPNEMTLHEFMKKVCAEWKTDEPWDADHLDDYMTVEYERSKYSWYNMKVWKQKDTPTNYSSTSNAPDLEFTISDKGFIQGRHRADPYYLDDVDGLVFKAFAQMVNFTDFQTYESSDDEYILKEDPH